jgi:hypothetical protein
MLTNKLPAARRRRYAHACRYAAATKPQPPESFADYGGMLLSMAHFGSNMWQPPVASAAEGTTALEEDKVNARNTHHNSIWRRVKKRLHQ